MNNNVRHSVGDRVVALDSSGNDLAQQPRVKGKIYTIEAVMYCTNCGKQLVNIGCRLESYHNNKLLCACGNRQENNGLHYSFAGRFAKVDETSLQQAVEEENYELAVIIRDALKTEKV